jgi:hypothetical protein
MAEPREARITCSLCNGWYVSERELRDRMQLPHRRFISQQSTLRYGGTEEEWAELSVQLRNRVRVHFNPEELEAVERFILLASQGSIFDDVRR